MLRRAAVLFLLAALWLKACSLPNGILPADQLTAAATFTNIPPSATPPMTEPLPSGTPAPSRTPSPSPTIDSKPATMRSSRGDLLCRFGPGLRYGVGGSLGQGEQVLISARNGAGDWFQFELPGYPGKYCWVAARDVETEGDLARLGIAEAPLSYVTNVSVLFDPPVLEPAVCTFPLTLTVVFTIETIGPTFVTFQRSQSNGLKMPPQTVEFSEAGPRIFEDYLEVDSAGEHWYRVSVTSPNSLLGQGVGTVVCP